MADNQTTSNIVFLTVNGTTLNGAQLPSSIAPTNEITRNTERSLDGTLYVDLVYEKEALEINWDYLTNADYSSIRALFPINANISIAYLNKTAKSYYVENVSATPFVIDDNLAWQAVSIKVVET